MRQRALISFLICAIFGLAACEPRKPGEPRPPTPKVDFTHERSTS